MSFFVTSEGVAQGGHLGGLAGADRQCQTLAKAVGAADRTWRAYLSTSFKGAPAANAGDRIGAGPWYNAKGVLVARGPIDLHKKGALDPALVAHRERRRAIGLRDGRADRHPRRRHRGSGQDVQQLDGHLRGGRRRRCRTGLELGPDGHLRAPRAAGAQPRLYCFALK